MTKKFRITAASAALYSFAAYPIATFFTLNIHLQIALAVITGCICSPLTYQILHYVKTTLARKNLQFFLQVAVSHLNVGNSLYVSLNKAADALLQSKSVLPGKTSLKSLQSGLELLQSFSKLYPIFTAAFPCPESRIFFRILEKPTVLGRNTGDLFRQYEISLRENLEREDARQAEMSKTFFESLSLLCMPPLMIVCLARSSATFFAQAYANVFSQILLLTSYLLFVSSSWFMRRIFLPRDKQHQNRRQKTKTSVKTTSMLLTLPIMRNKVMEDLSFRSLQTGINLQALILQYNFFNIRYCLYGLALSLLLFTVNEPPFIILLLIPLFMIYPTYRLHEDCRETKYQQLTSLPFFFHYLILSLHAGLGLQVAFKNAEESFPNDFPVLKLIKRMNLEIHNRVPCEEAIEHFSRHISLPEASGFMRLILQFSQHGKGKDLEILHLQFRQLLNRIDTKEKKSQARAGNRYILPMVMNLISVVLICFAPVYPAFQLSLFV